MSILESERNQLSEEDIEKIRLLESQIKDLNGKEKARVYQKIWRIKNRDKDRQYQRESYVRNLDKQRERKSRYYHEVGREKQGRSNTVGRPRKYQSPPRPDNIITKDDN
jgi:hypothetical protein